MKKTTLPAILVLACFFASAQQPPLVVIHKNYTDSLSTHKSSPPTIRAELYAAPAGLEAIDPRATLLSTNSLGKVYCLQPDNMRVLAPNMALLEAMPGSRRNYTPAPPSNMPNPLYPPRKKSWQ